MGPTCKRSFPFRVCKLSIFPYWNFRSLRPSCCSHSQSVSQSVRRTVAMLWPVQLANRQAASVSMHDLYCTCVICFDLGRGVLLCSDAWTMGGHCINSSSVTGFKPFCGLFSLRGRWSLHLSLGRPTLFCYLKCTHALRNGGYR